MLLDLRPFIPSLTLLASQQASRAVLKESTAQSSQNKACHWSIHSALQGITAGIKAHMILCSHIQWSSNAVLKMLILCICSGEESRSPDGEHEGMLVKTEPQDLDVSIDPAPTALAESSDLRSPFEASREQEVRLPNLQSLPSVSTPSHPDETPRQPPPKLKLPTERCQEEASFEHRATFSSPHQPVWKPADTPMSPVSPTIPSAFKQR